MSAETVDRWRESVMSVCALVVLAAVFWFGSHGPTARGGSDGNAAGWFNLAGLFDERSDFDYCESDDWCECDEPELMSMPAFVDLEASIEELRDARENMTKSAMDRDGKQIIIAADQYREAVKEVQAGFAKLKTRVAPDAFACVSENLMCSYDTDEPCLLTAWELGDFAGEIAP